MTQVLLKKFGKWPMAVAHTESDHGWTRINTDTDWESSGSWWLGQGHVDVLSNGGRLQAFSNPSPSVFISGSKRTDDV